MPTWPTGHRWEDYRVDILDETMTWIGTLGTCRQLRGDRTRWLQHGAKLTFALDRRDPWASILREREDHFIRILRDEEHIWSGYQTSLVRDDELGRLEGWIAFQFVPLARILSWRVGVNASVAIATTATIDDAFKYIVRRTHGALAGNTPTSALSRVIAGFTVAADTSSHPTTADVNANIEDVYEFIQQWGYAYGVDADVYFDDDYNPTFQTYYPARGVDRSEENGVRRPIIFTDAQGSFTKQDYGWETGDIKTVVMDRLGTKDQAAGATRRSAFGLREFTVDTGTDEVMTVALADRNFKESYKLEGFVETQDKQWRHHWKTGDTITWNSTRLGYGPHDDPVAKVTFAIDQPGFEHLTPTFGEPIPDFMDKLRGGGRQRATPGYTTPAIWHIFGDAPTNIDPDDANAIGVVGDGGVTTTSTENAATHRTVIAAVVGGSCWWARDDLDSGAGVVTGLRTRIANDPVMIGTPSADLTATPWESNADPTVLDVRGLCRVKRTVYANEASLAVWGMDAGIPTVHVVDETGAVGGAGGGACVFDIYNANVAHMRFDANIANSSFVRGILEIHDAAGVIAHSFSGVTGVVVFNEQGLITGDLRWESDNNVNMLYCDAGTERVGVGIIPTAVFHVYHATSNQIARFESGDGTIEIRMIDGAAYTAFTSVAGNLRVWVNDAATNPFTIDNNAPTDCLDLTSAGVVVNDGGSATVDLRVASDTNDHALFVDATGAGAVEIWNSADLELYSDAAVSQVGLWDGATGSIEAARDADVTSYIGRAAVGYNGVNADSATFAHVDHNSGTNYALRQTSLGDTILNAPTGRGIWAFLNGTSPPAIVLHVGLFGTELAYQQVSPRLYSDASVTLTGSWDAATGDLSLRRNAELRFYDNGNYVGFEAGALGADQIWILPLADGAAGEALVTNGGGTLSWAAPAPGVHNILSASHGDTLAAAVSRGSLIYGNATPAWAELVHLGASYHLQTDANDVLWAQNITMIDQAWVGIGAAAERWYFNAAGGYIGLRAANLLLMDAGSLRMYDGALGNLRTSIDGATGAAVFNEFGDAAGDLRVEADTNDHALFVDATGAGAVEIWNSADLELYSDAAVSQVGLWDGATGSITTAGDIYMTDASAVIQATTGFLRLLTAGNQNMYFDAGGFFLFRDADGASVVRAYIDSATGRIDSDDGYTVAGAAANRHVLIGDGVRGVFRALVTADLPAPAAHDVLSVSHGDTLAAAVSRGSIIVGNATPAWSELVVGAANTHLESDGADVTWVTNITMAAAATVDGVDISLHTHNYTRGNSTGSFTAGAFRANIPVYLNVFPDTSTIIGYVHGVQHWHDTDDFAWTYDTLATGVPN